MRVETKSLHVSTKGFCDIIDITDQVRSALSSIEDLTQGSVTLFVSGSTAGLTTIEYESGCVEDLKVAFERMAPQAAHYAHNTRWGDGNGFAHIRAALLGASIQIPFSEKRLLTGTWQQIVLVDFDNRPRRREIILQFLGE
jgi:secondary thiamine-phosphate synthase enzyme